MTGDPIEPRLSRPLTIGLSDNFADWIERMEKGILEQ